jgi:ketosteroid isomerase-like protein
VTASTAHEALLHDLFAAIDACDSERFVGYLTPGAEFRFGSAPAVVGRDAIRQAVEGFFSTIAGLSHTLTRTVADGATLFCEGEVTYTRPDDSTVTLPFADVLRLEDGLFSSYRIYIDIGPLYAV